MKIKRTIALLLVSALIADPVAVSAFSSQNLTPSISASPDQSLFQSQALMEGLQYVLHPLQNDFWVRKILRIGPGWVGNESPTEPQPKPGYIEILHPERLPIRDLRAVFFDFDNTLW